MDGELPESGITAERTVEIGQEHTTNLFGKQQTPPGLPAAADVDPDEPIRGLGTPQLLAEVEFLGRESQHGTLPDGTGLVGIDATVAHRKAVPIGQTLLVKTELTEVSGRRITIEGTLRLSDSKALVGEVTNRLQVVRREAFKDGIEK